MQPPYPLSLWIAWGATFSSCCFINDLETEILRDEEVLKRFTDMLQTFAKKMKSTKMRKHWGGRGEANCSMFCTSDLYSQDF